MMIIPPLAFQTGSLFLQFNLLTTLTNHYIILFVSNMSKIIIKTRFSNFEVHFVGAGGLEPPVSERTDLQSVRLPITGYAPFCFSECKGITTF